MINLRYHVVSLTAVFLALAIGVAMGTGFLNTATVDQLKRQIRSAEGGIDDANAENTRLQAELERAAQTDEALLEAADLLVGGRLADVPVLVLASEDIDQGSLTEVRRMLAASGADLRGTLTVTDRLRLDAGDDDQLAEILGAEADNRPVLQSGLTTAVAAALLEAANRSPESDEPTPAVVQDLVDGGYLGYEAPPRVDGVEPPDAAGVLAGGSLRYLVLSGPEPATPDADFLLPVLRAMAAEGPVPVVLASAAVGEQAEETRAAVVAAVREDNDLRGDISTVDDLERLSGLLAAIWALDDLDAGIRGHYGLADGRQSETPGGT